MLPTVKNGCGHVVENSQAEKGTHNLKGTRNAETSYLVRFAAGNLFAFEYNFSGISRIKACYDIKERGLARPIGTDQTYDLPFPHREVQIGKGTETAKSSADPNTLKHILHPL